MDLQKSCPHVQELALTHLLLLPTSVPSRLFCLPPDRARPGRAPRRCRRSRRHLTPLQARRPCPGDAPRHPQRPQVKNRSWTCQERRPRRRLRPSAGAPRSSSSMSVRSIYLRLVHVHGHVVVHLYIPDLPGKVDADPPHVANLDDEDENFVLFETQTCKPDIIQSCKLVDTPARGPLKKRSTVGKSQKDFKTPSGNKLCVIATYTVDDDDDFIEPVIKTRSGKLGAPRKKDPAVSSRNITTTKRPNKRPHKFSFRVHPLKPGKYTHLESAHLLKAYILCDHAKQNYKDKILCRFDHGVTPDGQVLETIFTCGELAEMFDECGQIEGELMGFVMRHWKIDPSYNHVYGSADRVLLSPHFMTYVLDMDGLKSSRPFDVKRAADVYRKHVKEQDHLARAYLILIPYCKISPVSGQSHHVLYAMNKYSAMFDVLDSYPCAKGVRPSRSSFHSETVEIARRMVLLMKELYTKELYEKFKHHNWQVKAKRPNYLKLPTQGANQCGFYCLKFASDYDGEKLVDPIVDCDPRVNDWKAEYVFSSVFHLENKITAEELPEEIQFLARGTTALSTQGEALIALFTQ